MHAPTHPPTGVQMHAHATHHTEAHTCMHIHTGLRKTRRNAHIVMLHFLRFLVLLRTYCVVNEEWP